MEAHKLKARTAMLSIISNSILVTLKLVVGFAIGSISIISEGLHSGMDLAAALIAYVAVKKASVPPDADHAFGHGKFENISGVAEALLIIVAALLIVKEAVGKLLVGDVPEMLEWGVAVMLISVVVNIFVARRLYKVAKITDSPALEADALHLSTDVWTSVGVLVGLLLMKITGWAFLDPVVAIVVALVIFKAGYTMTREGLGVLSDQKLPAEEEKIILQILEDKATHTIEYHKLRTRKAGAERHVDLHLVVAREMPVSEAHDICEDIEQEIKQRLNNCTIVIHIEPCRKDCPACKPRCKTEDSSSVGGD